MVLQLSHFGISYLTCCEFASDFTCCLASSQSNLSVGNYWLKTLFDLEWPILKCVHSGKECQVAYAKLILTCNAMENLNVLYEILLLMCQWWSIEYRGLFLMKIHPVERKLYQIINGGTTALVYDESYLTIRGLQSYLVLCVIIVFLQLTGW